jgi:hypothetical protein
MPTPRLTATLLSATLLACLLFAGVAVTPLAQAAPPTAEEAQQAIQTAQVAVNTAFSEVTLADLARAPIDDLVDTLNAALATLGQAQAAYNASDYAAAITLAADTQATADAVRNLALTRRTEATVQGAVQVLAIIGGVAIALVVTYLLVTRWRRYQRQRRRDLLRMEIRLPKEPKKEEEGHE